MNKPLSIDGRQMSQLQLKLALGLDEATARRMPPNLTLPRTLVGGVWVYIKPAQRGRQARVIAICPTCDLHIAAGRIGQHFRIHYRRAANG